MTEADEVRNERALRHRATVLSSLLKVEAFTELEKVLQQKERRMSDLLWQVLIAPEGSTEPQRLLDHHRGFCEGMRYAMAVPHGAERKLRGEGEEEEEEMTADNWATWAR